MDGKVAADMRLVDWGAKFRISDLFIYSATNGGVKNVLKMFV